MKTSTFILFMVVLIARLRSINSLHQPSSRFRSSLNTRHELSQRNLPPSTLRDSVSSRLAAFFRSLRYPGAKLGTPRGISRKRLYRVANRGRHLGARNRPKPMMFVRRVPAGGVQSKERTPVMNTRVHSSFKPHISSRPNVPVSHHGNLNENRQHEQSSNNIKMKPTGQVLSASPGFSKHSPTGNTYQERGSPTAVEEHLGRSMDLSSNRLHLEEDREDVSGENNEYDTVVMEDHMDNLKKLQEQQQLLMHLQANMLATLAQTQKSAKQQDLPSSLSMHNQFYKSNSFESKPMMYTLKIPHHLNVKESSKKDNLKSLEKNRFQQNQVEQAQEILFPPEFLHNVISADDFEPISHNQQGNTQHSNMFSLDDGKNVLLFKFDPKNSRILQHMQGLQITENPQKQKHHNEQALLKAFAHLDSASNEEHHDRNNKDVSFQSITTSHLEDSIRAPKSTDRNIGQSESLEESLKSIQTLMETLSLQLKSIHNEKTKFDKRLHKEEPLPKPVQNIIPIQETGFVPIQPFNSARDKTMNITDIFLPSGYLTPNETIQDEEYSEK